MKRTKQIDLAAMRKTPKRFLLKPLTLGVATVLAGCSSNEEEVRIVGSVDECAQTTSLTQEQCEVAYQQALTEAAQTGPRYSSMGNCEAEFGASRCGSTGSFFTPFMTGFLVSEIIDEIGDFRERRYNPVYTYNRPFSSYNNRVMLADGTVIGSKGRGKYTVPKSAVTQKMPKVTRTVSRGGFGSVAAAKSSWGGNSGRSGRSSSWGG